MKKLMTLALGLMFVFGATAVFAQEKKSDDTTKKAPKKGKKAPKKDDTKTEKK
jgi:hypothetical protein